MNAAHLEAAAASVPFVRYGATGVRAYDEALSALLEEGLPEEPWQVKRDGREEKRWKRREEKREERREEKRREERREKREERREKRREEKRDER